MAQSGLVGKPLYNQVIYNYGTVSSIEGKYHLKLAGIGFLLARDPYTGRHTYGRDQAPTFVNKFGAGDPTYRDSSFFPHWAQINWKNGSKQDDFDDEGKFKTSKNINVTDETKLKLSYLLSTLSLAAGSVDVTCWAIDYSDSNKVYVGCSNGHVWYNDGSWHDAGDVSAVGGGTAGRRVNCLLFSKIGLNGARAAGSGQIYAGVGTPAGTGGKNAAQLYRYDGTWASAATFAGSDSVLALCEFNGAVYASLGGTGLIQSTTAANLASGWATSKDIDYPGYMYSLIVYNGRLYAGGGSPENTPGSSGNYLGTLYTFDGFAWEEVFPFTHTVIRSMCVYDNLLFIGTVHGHLYVYNRATVDLLYEMPTGTGIFDMKVYDDKLYMAVCYNSTTNSEEAVYIFDRAGTTRMHLDSNIKPYSMIVVGDELWIGGKDGGVAYKIDKTKYNADGELQSSYFNANLPNIDKTWFDVSVEVDSLPADTTVAIYYKTDESDAAWTKIDETTSDGTKLAIFAFPAGVSSKKLSWKITLATTTNTVTPTVRKVLIRYVIQPDFKYLWRFKVVCPDNLAWLDDTIPFSKLTSSTLANVSTITLDDTGGFPDPAGEKMYAVITDDETGTMNEFYYTGITGSTLTGCGGIGVNTIAGSKTFTVSIAGRHFHRKLLELKQRKAIIDFIDIDNIVYRVLMHDYSEEGWAINTTDGLENDVAVTLLQA
ncbi:MAG: hypothetical protein M1445_08485 [Bacteroidetes bacterium]|nr:hypothetical protein [Bacteroidota bacterium]